jgi:hypothetical protein
MSLAPAQPHLGHWAGAHLGGPPTWGTSHIRIGDANWWRLWLPWNEARDAFAEQFQLPRLVSDGSDEDPSRAGSHRTRLAASQRRAPASDSDRRAGPLRRPWFEDDPAGGERAALNRRACRSWCPRAAQTVRGPHSAGRAGRRHTYLTPDRSQTG